MTGPELTRQQEWRPVRVVDVELSASSWDPGVGREPVLAFVRLHTRALALVHLDPGTDLLDAVRAEVALHESDHRCSLQADPQHPPCLRARQDTEAARPSVSVVIATHDRPELLRRCVQSLVDQTLQPLEIITVDNARSSDAAERLVAELDVPVPVRYVREDTAGLGRAHNAGLAHARGEVIAITDDDVVADSSWVAALVEPFVDGGADAVTGLILPLELRTREQAWVEQYGGFARGFRRRTFSLADPPADDRLFPYTAGRFGSGANMAFSRSMLERIGGFDAALGAGTRAQGGDDLAAFARTVLSGGRLVYQPDAVVRHPHHDHYAALQRMATGYGVGLGAYLTSLVAHDPRVLRDLLRRAPAGLVHLLSPSSEKNANIRDDYPRDLVTRERIGVLRGPAAYAASRWAGRRAPDHVADQEPTGAPGGGRA